MTRINTNVASTRGLRNLNRASRAQNQALERLSTGTRINRGKDNPAGLIASENLRLQLTAIEQSITNSNRASNVISTADGALGEISGLLNQVRGLVQEGLNQGALSNTEIEANQLQIDAALSGINRIAQNTTFANEKLIDGTKAFTTQLTPADAAELSDFQVNELLFGSNNSVNLAATITTAAEKGTLTYAGGAPTGDLNFEIGGTDGNQVLFFDNSSTIADVASAVNSVTDSTAVSATVSTAAVNGTLAITSGSSAETLTLTERRATSDTIAVVFADATASSGTSITSVAGVGTGSVTITVELGDDGSNITATGQNILDAINADAASSALVSGAVSGSAEAFTAGNKGNVTTSKNVGELTFSSSEFGSDAFVDFNVLNGAFSTTNAAGSAASRDAGADVIANINGSQAVGKGLRASIKTQQLDASLTFTSAANVVGTATTISVTGGGSVFQIGEQASASGQIGVGIEAVNTARLGGVSGKLYELGSGGGKSFLDVGSGAQGSDLVKIIDEALERVSTLRGRLGAIQKNVIETNVSALGIALENISEARSQIVDTDFATETAELTRSQILSQAGISVLSIANQQPQQVLALLG